MSQFKARVVAPARNWHAMEIWLEADNIIDAGKDILETLMPLGITSDSVTRLIEVEYQSGDPAENTRRK